MKIIRSTTHCTSLVLNISHINPAKNKRIELKFLKYVYQCKITPFSSILKEKLLILLKTMFRSSIVAWFRNLNLVSIKTIMGFPGSSAGKESTCNAGDPGWIPGSGRSAGEGIGYPLQYSWASLVAQTVKNPPAMQET